MGQSPRLVDSHCHLDFTDFSGELDELIDRALAAGVGHILTICTRVTNFEAVLALAERFDNVFCTVGVHPHEAGREPEVTTERLISLARHPKVVGFGETGLDYHYEFSPKEAQRRSFRVHIEAARESGLPIVVHARDADDDVLAILAEEQAAGGFSGLIHCFSSTTEVALRVLDMGLYISFSGIVTFASAEALRETARRLPLERLLVETDAPYLAPAPKRGKRNEPAFAAFTAARLAELKGVPAAAFTAATTDNFFRLFGKARAPEGLLSCA